MGMSWGEYGNHLIKLAEEAGIPISGQFELTTRCNLKCSMCYIESPISTNDILAKERSAKEWIRLAEAARNEGMLYLNLTGGEVFIRQDFRLIYEELSKMGLVITINTNATLITPEIAKWLGKIPPSYMNVSIYGASADTYSKICRDANGYNRMVKGIELLLAEGVKLKFRTTVIRGNSNEFEDIAQLTDKYGSILYTVNYIYPKREEGNTCSLSERLTPQELVAYERKSEEYYQNKWKDISDRKSEEAYTLELPPIDHTVDKKHPFHCISGKSRFCITWDGRMLPCILLTNPVTYPFDMGFTDAWQELKTLCTRIPNCSECSHCKYKKGCMSCPAIRINETGFYDKPVPYLCDYMKNKYARR